MEVVTTLTVNGHNVTAKILSLENLPITQFNGQKILHPMEIMKKERTIIQKGKGNRTYEKRLTDVFYIPEFVSPEAEDAIRNPKLIGIKFDGSCGAMHYNPETNTHTMYTRIDLKFSPDDKILLCGKQYESVSDLPQALIPCENDPRNGDKYKNHGMLHWPFMIPIASSTAGGAVQILQLVEGINTASVYKWNIIAFENAVASGKLSQVHRNITCEQMGKQFNLKDKCDLMPKPALVPHNSMVLDIVPELCTFDGFCELLKTIPTIEGVVIYGNNGTVWKFRRDMIRIGEEQLEWPPKEAQSTDWAQRSALL